tara:strand:+ start:305 stop:679 length:375 start_codon:yes stop_codon:yes gene_type:complete
MKYCQGTKCHEYKTKDRIRGTKGDKHYQTRRRLSLYYGDNFCSMQCMNDWLNEYVDRAINHFGRLTEPKRVMCDQAWYKDYTWRGVGDNGTRHYFVNDLLGQRIPITEQQYNNKELTTPNNLSQ